MTVPLEAPLAGLRIIELSSFVAAPLGGTTLASLGADVIRVDPLGGGPDRNRWPIDDENNSLYWAELNQGKQSLTLDMNSVEGRGIVADLVAASGIMLTNARPRKGLSVAELRDRRPDLIHVQLNGRRDGSTAVDYTVNAECGFPALTGPENLMAPVNHVVPVWDVATGLYLVVGLLAAERHRLRTGEGTSLEVALHDVALATAGHLGYLAEAQLSAAPRARIGNDIYGDFGRDFAAADGERFMIVVLTRRHWADLLSVTGMHSAVTELEQATGADFGVPADRYRHRHALGDLLAGWFSAQRGPEVERALGQVSVLWSRYRTFAGLAADGALSAHPLLSSVTQPNIGAYLSPGSPLVFDGRQGPPSPAPRFGEHNKEILSDVLGLTDSAIADLVQRRIIAG